MDALPPPDPAAPPESLYEQARRLHERCAEKDAVIARIKAYFELWTRDRRMRVTGEIVLREIARIEQEERARAAAEGRDAR